MKQGFVPCEDDKPKCTEITLLQAGSDYYLSAKEWAAPAHVRLAHDLNKGINPLNNPLKPLILLINERK